MRYILLLILSVFMVACSSRDADEKPLAGERISVLDLQRGLVEQLDQEQAANITIPHPVTNREWPQAGGYPHHAMQNLAFGEKAQLEQIWKNSIGKGGSKQLPLTARPVIGDGRVYTLDSYSRLSAFHDQTGKLLWEKSVQHLVEKDPVITGGLAYNNGVVFATNGYNEALALSAQDGEIIWRTPLQASSRAAPTIKNGRVYVVQMNNNVTALNAADGSVLWEHEGIAESTGLLGGASPAADDTIILAALSSGEMTALRPENGSQLWTDNLSGVNRFSGLSSLSDIKALPILVGNIAIGVSYGGKMVAIDKATGARLWQVNISSSETPWVAGETIYVVTARNQLLSVNLYNGKVLWIVDLPQYADGDKKRDVMNWLSPLIGGGRIIIASSNGQINEYDPRNGALLASWSVGRPLSIAPILSNGALYLSLIHI